MDTKIISESSSSWSDLPREILWLIDQRLYLRDRVRFRFVCNNWRLPPLFDKLPWLFNRTICSLSDDPYRKLHYFTQKSKGSSHTPEGRYQFLAIASASRYGWILFHDKTTQALIKPKKLLIHNYSCEYYVYNPRTNAVISLPRLNLPQHHGYYFLHLATFSSDPTSLDCKFYVPTVSFMGTHFFINTYSIKDTKWELKIQNGRLINFVVLTHVQLLLLLWHIWIEVFTFTVERELWYASKFSTKRGACFFRNNFPCGVLK